MSNNLRQIGTRFETEEDNSQSTLGGIKMIFTWEVVGHVMCQQTLMSKPELGEEIRCIGIQEVEGE
jgi:hypothetical protein